MSLKVTVVTFVTPQLEKIHRLTASLFFLQDPPSPLVRIPLPFRNFSILPFFGFLVRSIHPLKNRGPNYDEVHLINSSANVFIFRDFNVYYNDWLNYSGEIDGSSELCYNFSIPNYLTQMFDFPTHSSDSDSHNPAFLDLFLLTLVFVLQRLFLHHEILIISLSQFPLTFHQTQNRMPCFIREIITILVLIGKVFVINWEMFHGRMFLNLVLLLMLIYFLSGLRLEQASTYSS